MKQEKSGVLKRGDIFFLLVVNQDLKNIVAFKISAVQLQSITAFPLLAMYGQRPGIPAKWVSNSNVQIISCVRPHAQVISTEPGLNMANIVNKKLPFQNTIRFTQTLLFISIFFFQTKQAAQIRYHTSVPVTYQLSLIPSIPECKVRHTNNIED